jgi:xylitol oxidase
MQNWSKNIDFNERQYFQPESLVELQELVRTHPKIRARGTAHCFNDIADINSVAINVGKMPKVIEVNSNSKSVKVSAGLTYGELAPVLHRHSIISHLCHTFLLQDLYLLELMVQE